MCRNAIVVKPLEHRAEAVSSWPRHSIHIVGTNPGYRDPSRASSTVASPALRFARYPNGHGFDGAAEEPPRHHQGERTTRLGTIRSHRCIKPGRLSHSYTATAPHAKNGRKPQWLHHPPGVPEDQPETETEKRKQLRAPPSAASWTTGGTAAPGNICSRT